MAEQKKSGCGCLTFLIVIVIAICVLVAGNEESSSGSNGHSSYTPTQADPYRPRFTIPYEPTYEPTYDPTYEPTYAPTLPPFDRLPGLDDSYEGHLFLDMKGLGDCTKLSGNIVLTFLMVDDRESVWTSTDLAEFEATVHAATQELYINARDYSVPVTITSRFVRCSSNGTLAMQNSHDWAESAVTSAGYSFTTGCTDVAAQYGADQATFFLCVNRTGRPFAHPAYGRTGFEYAVLYREHGDYRHELNHLFGAEDFYYPQEVQDLSEQLLPNSIMNDSNSSMVDELTAYLIGWTDAPGPNALAFLNRTASITQDDMAKAYEETTYTGYGTRRWGEGYFTGNWVDGIPEGYGTDQSDNGDYYEGDHVYGSRHGQGTFRWANGAVDVGPWVNGNMHGYGVYTWDGNRYEGDFADGVAQGQGTYTWANGCTYTGDIQNWELTGYGTYRWADGTVYVGDWVNGNMHGYGTCTYTNGTQRTGTWQNGNFIG